MKVHHSTAQGQQGAESGVRQLLVLVRNANEKQKKRQHNGSAHNHKVDDVSRVLRKERLGGRQLDLCIHLAGGVRVLVVRLEFFQLDLSEFYSVLRVGL